MASKNSVSARTIARISASTSMGEEVCQELGYCYDNAVGKHPSGVRDVPDSDSLEPSTTGRFVLAN